MDIEQQMRAAVSAHNENENSDADDRFGSWVGVNCEIHPADEIFRFFYQHPLSQAPFRDYVTDGWRSVYELMVVLERMGRSLATCQSFLEFASGYGRLTRHLARFPGAQNIWASDVMPGSVDFVTEKFGVNGFYSDTDPSKVVMPRQFEVVFVLSLFSHLPQETWSVWLSKLFDAVSDGGCLIFTTHGDDFAQKNGLQLDASGFYFDPSSESVHLEGKDYGTTITSADYVKNALAALENVDRVFHEPSHFWSGQDAWSVTKCT